MLLRALLPRLRPAEPFSSWALPGLASVQWRHHQHQPDPPPPPFKVGSPVEIKLRRNLKRLQVQYDDGAVFSFSAEFLRVKSPSVDNQRTDARGIERVPAGRKHVDIMSLEPVGNYAIRIKFDDLHQSGIYTWQYLYDLGRHKLQYSRQYIRALRARGLSREPPRSGAPRRTSQAPGGAEKLTGGSSSEGAKCLSSHHAHGPHDECKGQ